MKNTFLHNLINHYWVLIALAISFLLIIIAAVMLYLNFAHYFESPIILHRELYRDEIVLGSISDLYGFIFTGLVLVTINFALIGELIVKKLPLACILVSGTLLFAALILIAAGDIIRIN